MAQQTIALPHSSDRLFLTDGGLEQLNRTSIAMLRDIRDRHATPRSPMVISGCIGPRGDGYRPSARMSAAEAERYHLEQIRCFRREDCDLVSAFTMNYTQEAIGITRAAQSVDLPAVISFTVGTDGRLPSGESLKEAIQGVDAATENGPAYYMINCAHPSHFRDALTAGEGWRRRIGGIRANASARSHAELDESETLDAGDPVELAAQYRQLLGVLPEVRVLGGVLRHRPSARQRDLQGVYRYVRE